MNGCVSDSDTSIIYGAALRYLVEGLGAHRALIIMLDAKEQPNVVAFHGIESSRIWGGNELSTTILKSVLKNGAPISSHQAFRDPRFASRWSLQMSGLRGLLCHPIRRPGGGVTGLLYADSSENLTRFGRQGLASLKDCANRLEAVLYGTAKVFSPPQPVHEERGIHREPMETSSKAQVARRSRPIKPSGAPQHSQPSSKELSIMFRSLAVMVEAGILLYKGLEMLAGQSATPATASLCNFLADSVAQGNRLSEAMSHCQAFDRFQIGLVRVGEEIGGLNLVLNKLASHQERRVSISMRLRAALVYPAALLVVCLTLMVFGLPYMLHDILSLLMDSGVEAPFLTRVLFGISSLVRNPVAILIALVSAVILVKWGRRWISTEKIERLTFRIPRLKEIVQAAMMAKFCASLSTLLEAGALLPKALRLSALASGGILEQPVGQAIDKLMDGVPLAESFLESSYFPPMVSNLVAVGEESGSMARTMSWISDYYERELECRLDALAAVLEPMIMIVMGLIVGVVLAAVMLPMSEALKAF